MKQKAENNRWREKVEGVTQLQSKSAGLKKRKEFTWNRRGGAASELASDMFVHLKRAFSLLLRVIAVFNLNRNGLPCSDIEKIKQKSAADDQYTADTNTNANDERNGVV